MAIRGSSHMDRFAGHLWQVDQFCDQIYQPSAAKGLMLQHCVNWFQMNTYLCFLFIYLFIIVTIQVHLKSRWHWIFKYKRYSVFMMWHVTCDIHQQVCTASTISHWTKIEPIQRFQIKRHSGLTVESSLSNSCLCCAVHAWMDFTCFHATYWQIHPKQFWYFLSLIMNICHCQCTTFRWHFVIFSLWCIFTS